MARRSAGLSLLLAALPACSVEAPSADVVIDTLPDGVARFTYAAIPSAPLLEAIPDLTIGGLAGDGPDVFGDVRSVDAARDGAIYVLDAQAAEIRVFDADGRHLRTLGGRGEGPGEITAANGLQLVGDTLVWILDHGKGSLLALHPDGTEVERRPMPVLSWSYAWTGTIDREGRYWRPDVHVARGPEDEPEPGLHEDAAVHHLARAEPPWTDVDSLVFAESVLRMMVFETAPGSRLYFQIPFDPRPLSAVDLDGGFWVAPASSYQLARHDVRGEVVLRIEADVRAPPVSPADRATFLEPYGRSPDRLRAAEEVADMMPSRKPPIESLTVDDTGRLWVGRASAEPEPPLYDVFARDGRFLGSVRFGFEPVSHVPLRIRHGHIYAPVRDSLDVTYVVRAPVPGQIGA